MSMAFITLPRLAARFLPVLFMLLFQCGLAKAADLDAGILVYKGFTVDMTKCTSQPNLDDIIAYAKHQLDIVADCDADEKTMTFFRSERILMVPNLGHGGGFVNLKGIVHVDSAIEKATKPIFLHELLHAYHFLQLPDGRKNADVIKFWKIAQDNQLYPAGSYVLSNQAEFFAVTASCYLWGTVDRPPFTRENIKKRQPIYTKWLAQLFGVEK